MAVSNSKKSTASKSKIRGLKLNFKKLNKGKALTVSSVVLNVLLLIALLFSISNPTSFTDASSGYTVEIPAGWTRQDEFEVFRITKGGTDNPEARIYVYGQRNATLGFYDSSKEDRDSILDQVTDQINQGQNQFILSRFNLTDYSFTAKRGQKPDGTEYIQTHFTANDSDGQAVEGEHLLIISKAGGIYSVVGYADANYWSQVSDQVAETMSSFTAP